MEIPTCRAVYSFVVNHFLGNQFTGNIEVDHRAIKAFDNTLVDVRGSRVIFVDARACKKPNHRWRRCNAGDGLSVL